MFTKAATIKCEPGCVTFLPLPSKTVGSTTPQPQGGFSMALCNRFIALPFTRQGLTALVSLSIASFAYAGEKADATKANVEDGIAIHGYDPLSYLEGHAKKGSKEYSTAFEGATYLFTSKKHLDSFKLSPNRYEPSYKGWCAYAMAEGDKVDVDPETFKVIDGRVYLFYNGFLGNTLKKWNKDESNLHKKANEQWKKMN
jgi:YHS domain-containing protein